MIYKNKKVKPTQQDICEVITTKDDEKTKFTR